MTGRSGADSGAVGATPGAPSSSGVSWPDAGFLAVPPTTPQTRAMYDGDVETMGFVMNLSRLWAQLPEAQDQLSALLGTAARTAGLTFRQRGILVTACASTMGDAYCSLAWGNKLAREAGAQVAGGVLRGDDDLLDDAERVLARRARRVARDPNATTPADVQELRDVGYDDQQIFAVTLFVALRLAFSTVNDALGALPDRALDAEAEAPVRDAVTFGRPVGSGG